MIVIILESTRKQEFPDLIMLIQTERSIIITTIVVINSYCYVVEGVCEGS